MDPGEPAARFKYNGAGGVGVGLNILDLLRAFCTPKPLDPPKTTESISAEDLRDIITRDLGVPREHIHLSDAKYDLYPRSELDRFLSDDRTNGRKYVPAAFDCDNFAAVLFGNESIWQSRNADSQERQGSTAFGIVWGDIKGVGPHALCFWIDSEDRTAKLVEPQNDSVFRLPTDSTTWLVLC